MSVETRIARRRAQLATRELFEWPRVPKFKRVPSKQELVSTAERVALGANAHDIFKCVHGKHYFTPCVACRRDQREADMRLGLYKQKLAQVQAKIIGLNA